MVTAISYAEVFEILRLLGKDNVEKIPLKILEKIDKCRDKNYIVNIDVNCPLNQQNISRKALAMFAWLNLEYMSTEEEREVLTGMYELNERRDKHIANDFQFNVGKTVIAEKKIQEISLIETKPSFWMKVINRLKLIFKK